MSYQGDDRNERESVNASSSIIRTSTDKDKPALDKPKTVTGSSSAPTTEGQIPPRPAMDLAKTSKPLPNRPIAPAAAAAGVMPMGTSINTGYLPPAMPGYGHPTFPGYPMLRGTLGSLPPQHTYGPHVPFGASAAAISASAHPKGIGQIRSTTMSATAKLPGMPPHHPGQPTSLPPQVTGSVATTSRSSSPTLSAPSTNSGPSFHQPSSEYKQADVRDRGSPHVPDITRKTSSPHCSSPSVQSTGAIVTNTKPNIPSPVVPVHKPAQPIMLPHFTQGHNPLAVATFPQPAVAGTIQQPSSVTSVGLAASQSKPVQSVPVPVASIAKMYPPHLSLVQGRPGLGQSEGPASPDISRLSGKQSGPASPVTIPQHSASSTAPSTTHLIAATTPLQTSTVVDGRMDRPHQGVSLPNTMIPSQMYSQYVFSEPPRAYPLPFPHSGFPQAGLQSGIRPPHTQTTATMQGMHILDHPTFFAATRNLSAGSMPSDALGPVAMMDSSAANAGIYSMQIGMQQAPSLQVTVSTSNPNATSPRPSILRKRTSEGVRKATVVPYNNDVPPQPPVTSEPAASPRSDSTLSAPQSGQSSPKPPSVSSESGAQVEQQPPQIATPATTSATTDSTSQPTPASPVTVKKEPNEPAVPPTASTAVTSSAAMVTSTSSTVTDKPTSVSVALPDGASPRKKPRKQNVVVTEDKYGSSVPLEEASSEDEEKKSKPPPEDTMDDELKFILRKRPKISIFGGYKVNTKAAHNHFLKYSDVRIKEERKPTVQDIANQKGILHRVSGWRVHHVAAQMDDLSSVEQEVLQKLFEFRENLPKPRPGQKTKYHDELIMLDELVQGNIQRSQLVAEQLADIRKVMVKVLDHRPRCMEILQKYMNKRNPKKKA